MPLESPNLDDRTFDELVAAAVDRIHWRDGAWRDLSVGDPGMVLLDAFAFVTEQLLFRVNRIPEKAYVAFLNLIGARLYPPTAATAVLTFTLQAPASAPVAIPRGTRVGAQRSGDTSDAPIVFATVDDATIPAGATSAAVRAHNADTFVDEPLGVGTGGGSQSFTVAHAPIVGTTGDAADLLVAVELQPDEAHDRVNARVIDGVSYRVWDEVQSFADADAERPAYVVDRASGTIAFAPRVRTSEAGTLAADSAFLAPVPAAGARIRVSYATGGGIRGNVAPGTLTVLKDPVLGASVTNVAAATGGRAGETLENALIRGPREFQSLQRAVTARDFELIAETQTGAVARAKAYAKRELWNYAAPGTVEVLLVPEYLAPGERGNGAVTADALVAQQSAETLQRIAQVIEARRPLGISCLVSWVHYKRVKVVASVVVTPGENASAVHDRILARLHLLINPLPTPASPGWRFGRTLRVSDVVAVILAEPGVAYYDTIALVVDDVPNTDVAALVADPTQPKMWFAAAGPGVYRTLNDGDGWERAGNFPGEQVVRIRPSAEQPGAVAIASRITGDDGTSSVVRVSADAGETWRDAVRLEKMSVTDIAWIARPHGLALLITTNKGLYELENAPGAVAIELSVHKDDSQFGFSRVAVMRVRGALIVAVSAEAQGGVYLSNHGGADGSFVQWGQAGTDIPVLAVQRFGETAYLWAGFAARGAVAGTGCARRELTGADPAIDPSRWQPFATNWDGGSVMGLAFHDTLVYAASHDAGVLSVDSNAANASWHTLPLGSGLPEREKAGFQIVSAVAASADGTVLAGGPQGVYRSADGTRYVEVSRASFDDRVVLPLTWLFVSGAHEVDVRNEGG